MASSRIANPPASLQPDPFFQRSRVNGNGPHHHHVPRDTELNGISFIASPGAIPNEKKSATPTPVRKPPNVDMTESVPSNQSNATHETDVSGAESVHTDDDEPGTPSEPCSSQQSSLESSGDESSGNFEQHQFPPLMPTTERRTRARIWGGQVRAINHLAERLAPEEVKLNSEVDHSSSDASISAASSTASSDDELRDLWTRLQDQRRETKELRTKMSAKRNEIRRLRDRKDDADNAFMRFVRPHLLTGSRGPYASEDVISHYFEKMQNTRNEYNSAESEYEILEFELDREEKELQVIETQFFTLLYGATRGNHADYTSEDSEDEDYVPPSRTSLLGISGDRPADVHPLYRQLLDAVGDRELAREHHTDLILHRDSILVDLELELKRDSQGRSQGGSSISEEELESLKSGLAQMGAEDIKTRFGATLREEDLEFLREFPEDEKAAREKLSETKREVDQLREECIKQGVMRKHVSYYEEYTIFSDVADPLPGANMTINGDAMPRKGDSLADPRFPILLSNPMHVLAPEPLTVKAALRAATKLPKDDPTKAQQTAEAIKEFGINTLVEQFEPEHKSDYINRWLLHRLRISPLEVDLLYTIFSSFLKVINLRRWQDDVLHFWPRDDANRSPSEFVGPVTPRDDLEIDDTDVSSLVNSIINPPSRAGSDRGDEPRPWAGQTPPRAPKSVS